MNTIGIRREDKGEMERRVALVPEDVNVLVEQHDVTVQVQSSSVRAFPDDDYRSAGAQVVDSLADAEVILGVKEVPAYNFATSDARTWMFFSHTIKGQAYNMEMLQRILDGGHTLFDYEAITDQDGRRLVFFGRHAGYAGMLETLVALGRKLQARGIDNPLAELERPYRYPDLEHAMLAVHAAGQRLAKGGFSELGPITIGLLGYGNVSLGAQRILSELPVEFVLPDQLEEVRRSGRNDVVYVALFREEHLAERSADGGFDLDEFLRDPSGYRSKFHRYLPHLTVAVNAIYWEPRYPVYIPNGLLQKLAREGQLSLEVIGDITCDIDGSVEATYRPTTPEEPFFTYHPDRDAYGEGLEPDGVTVMAIDNLPCELPVDASRHFSRSLLPYVVDFARADLSSTLEDTGLPDEVVRACIVWRGELTPAYRYLEEHLKGSTDSGE